MTSPMALQCQVSLQHSMAPKRHITCPVPPWFPAPSYPSPMPPGGLHRHSGGKRGFTTSFCAIAVHVDPDLCSPNSRLWIGGCLAAFRRRRCCITPPRSSLFLFPSFPPLQVGGGVESFALAYSPLHCHLHVPLPRLFCASITSFDQLFCYLFKLLFYIWVIVNKTSNRQFALFLFFS